MEFWLSQTLINLLRIEYLLENKQFAEELGRNAEKTVEEEFTWEKSAETFIETYGETFNSRKELTRKLR